MREYHFKVVRRLLKNIYLIIPVYYTYTSCLFVSLSTDKHIKVWLSLINGIVSGSTKSVTGMVKSWIMTNKNVIFDFFMVQ